MNAFSDRNGWYRLDAVAAITPHVIHKSAPHVAGKAPEVECIVAVLHLAGGSTVVTATNFDDVVAMYKDAGTGEIAPPNSASEGS